MTSATYVVLYHIIMALCKLSMLYILFSPTAMWVYLGLCVLSGSIKVEWKHAE